MKKSELPRCHVGLIHYSLAAITLFTLTGGPLAAEVGEPGWMFESIWFSKDRDTQATLVSVGTGLGPAWLIERKGKPELYCQVAEEGEGKGNRSECNDGKRRVIFDLPEGNLVVDGVILSREPLPPVE